MKKILTLLMLLVSLATASAKCTWASVKIEQMNSQEYFLWRITGDAFKDTCVKYDYTLIDLSTNQVVGNLIKGGLWPRIYFKRKGKYRFDLKLKNTCTGCDTTIYDYVDYHFFNQCFLNYRMLSTYDSSCIDSLAGEMTKGSPDPANGCWSYGFNLIKGGNLDSFTDDQWANDTTLFRNGFDYSTGNIVYRKSDTLDFARKLNYKFRKPGRYLLAMYWSHYCGGNDTMELMRFTIDPCVTLKTKDIPSANRKSPKVIGIYDMLGRPVKHIRKDEIMIYLYDDGSSKKIIQN